MRSTIGSTSTPSTLRNYAHNLKRTLPRATVTAHEAPAPSTFAALSSLLARRPRPGTHVHASPPCQAFVNNSGGSKGKPQLGPVFELMVAVCRAGGTASFEEHVDCKRVALEWLATQPEATRKLVYVYEVTARDYGSPTGRERCVATTFPLEGETRLRPEHD